LNGCARSQVAFTQRKTTANALSPQLTASEHHFRCILPIPSTPIANPTQSARISSNIQQNLVLGFTHKTVRNTIKNFRHAKRINNAFTLKSLQPKYQLSGRNSLDKAARAF